MNTRIKLLHITSSLKIGGAENVLYQLISLSDAKQFDHHVIYFHDGPYVEKIRNLGIPLYQVKGLFFRYDFFFFISLLITVMRIRPDCIHTLLWVANACGRIMAWILRISCISVFHNNIDQDGSVRNCIDYITLRCADMLVAVSQEVAQSVYAQHEWLPARAIKVIPNGIVVSDHISVVTREHLGIAQHSFIVGAVGRLELVKNYNLLLDSFAQLKALRKDVRLIIVGDGSEKMRLIERAKQLNIINEVLFLGSQNSHDYYQLFDCFVMTSDKEGVSIALLEAMSYEKACIVTNISKEHAVIEHGINGVIIPAGNKKELTDWIFALSDNLPLRTQLGSEAKKAVNKDFSAVRMVSEYSDLFKKFAGK